MSIILLTGPVASGKNSVANALCQRRARAADIDVDQLRWMYRKPHYAPWDGAEGVEQMKLSARHACLLAKPFEQEGLEVFITDVVSGKTLEIYREELPILTVIQLMPSWEVCLERLNERPQTVTKQEARWVFEQQQALRGYDYQINSNKMDLEETITAIEDAFRGIGSHVFQ